VLKTVPGERSFLFSLGVWKYIYSMEKGRLIPSKLTRAEEIWGMDVLAKVFADINNRGRRKAKEYYEWLEWYDHLACMKFLLGDRFNK
jgi:hypothetical protein